MDDQNQKTGLPAVSLRQMRYALAAADSGNVTEAARQLNVSQPAISAAIAVLEAHYGTALFTRQPGQGVSLTRFGRSLFTEIRGLLKQARSVFDLSESSGPLRGEATIGIYEALAPYYLPAVLQRLASELPEVRVTFFEAELDQLVTRLHDGSADHSITYDVGLDPGIATETLYSLRPFILLPREHPLGAEASARLSCLHHQPLILLDQEASAQYVLGLLHARGVEPSEVIRVKSFELQRSLVANGQGLALSHTRPLVATSYDGKPLVAVPVSDRIAPQRVLLASSRRHRPSPISGAVARSIQNTFSKLPRAAVDGTILINRKKHA